MPTLSCAVLSRVFSSTRRSFYRNERIDSEKASYRSLYNNPRYSSKSQTGTRLSLTMHGSSRSNASYVEQSDFLLPAVEEPPQEEDEYRRVDWLQLAESRLEQDFETTTKELELIKSILDDLEIRIRADKRPSRRVRDQRILLGACQAYSSSMCDRLRERSQQVKFWISSRQMGRRTPDSEPEDWRQIDLEWRKWLSTQAVARLSQLDQPVSPLDFSVDPENDVAWRVWGPLAHILTSYMWCNEN